MSSEQNSVPSAPFLRQWEETVEEVLAAVRAVGESGWYILGERVASFEAAVAERFGVARGVGCASGLDAIEIALRAAGLGPGEPVLTTPLSAFATTLAVVRAGGVPVFVDVDESGLIDLERAEEALQDRDDLRFFLPVHLYGHPLNLEHLEKLRDRHDLTIVEDCAQAIGAGRGGRGVGTVGAAAAVSFYPTKNLGALGDGGALLTDDEALAERAASLRDYGQAAKFEHVRLGMNSRLDELHAAVLEEVYLPRLERWNARRGEIACRYVGGIDHPFVRSLPAPEGRRSVWHLFPVRVPHAGRDDFREHMASEGIGTQVHYPHPIPDQPALSDVEYETVGDLETARSLTRELVSLPIHPYLEDDEVERVIEAVNSWNRE